ncbi:jg9946 [Pararge aegeria aegeria]|uniref:Jg9946 protein n=1 Tax=Pararge aegeria aegeria TaxID=348720 RepID=A0A8S4SBJ2_9NEOP|nr:jg9946 [Pararge aegeria aegeria]
MRPLMTDLEIQNSAFYRQNNRGNNPFLDNYSTTESDPSMQRIQYTDIRNYANLTTHQLNYINFHSSADRDSLRSCDTDSFRSNPYKTMVPRRRCSSRYGTMIGDTVESWARTAAQQRSNKPLVFGGTYPIDEPTNLPSEPSAPLSKPRENLPIEQSTQNINPIADRSEHTLATSKESVHSPKRIPNIAKRSVASSTELTIDPEAHRRKLRETIEESVEKFEAMLALKGGFKREKSVLTFPIDEPLDWADDDVLPKEDDARYFVTSNKTFDVDEPVTI